MHICIASYLHHLAFNSLSERRQTSKESCPQVLEWFAPAKADQVYRRSFCSMRYMDKSKGEKGFHIYFQSVVEIVTDPCQYCAQILNLIITCKRSKALNLFLASSVVMLT